MTEKVPEPEVVNEDTFSFEICVKYDALGLTTTGKTPLIKQGDYWNILSPKTRHPNTPKHERVVGFHRLNECTVVNGIPLYIGALGVGKYIVAPDGQFLSNRKLEIEHIKGTKFHNPDNCLPSFNVSLSDIDLRQIQE